MIAYAFWHWPAAEAAGYEERLAAFHAALDAERPAGFLGACCFKTGAAPWLPGPAYLDWYRLGGFGDLEALNQGAVTASRKAPHDAAAALAAGGAGGIYHHKSGATDIRPFEIAHWFAKPRGMPYEELLARLADAPGSLWMRQMVLGPSPEFVLFGAEQMPFVGISMSLGRVWSPDRLQRDISAQLPGGAGAVCRLGHAINQLMTDFVSQGLLVLAPASSPP